MNGTFQKPLLITPRKVRSCNVGYEGPCEIWEILRLKAKICHQEGFC
jgi:hypothetical protein